MLRSTVIVHLNCGSSVISSFCLQQCIDCDLNLPINEKQCLLQAKQGVYAIIRQKALVCFVFSLKVLEATFCVGVKTCEKIPHASSGVRYPGFDSVFSLQYHVSKSAGQTQLTST